MFNLDSPSLHLHYLHQNGPSLTLNPLSGEQISPLNLHALPSVGKLLRGIFISIRRRRWSDTAWTVARMWNKCVPAASARDFLSPVSWRSRHPSPGFHGRHQKRVWWQRRLSRRLHFFYFFSFIHLFCRGCVVFISRLFRGDGSKASSCEPLCCVVPCFAALCIRSFLDLLSVIPLRTWCRITRWTIKLPTFIEFCTRPQPKGPTTAVNWCAFGATASHGHVKRSEIAGGGWCEA